MLRSLSLFSVSVPGRVCELGLAALLGSLSHSFLTFLRPFPSLQCHTHFVHEFGPRVSVAIGKNGSGKSAMLQVGGLTFAVLVWTLAVLSCALGN